MEDNSHADENKVCPDVKRKAEDLVNVLIGKGPHTEETADFMQAAVAYLPHMDETEREEFALFLKMTVLLKNMNEYNENKEDISTKTK